jgi:hypothetical protein
MFLSFVEPDILIGTGEHLVSIPTREFTNLSLAVSWRKSFWLEMVLSSLLQLLYMDL